MVGQALRFVAVAIAAQVAGDDGVVLRQGLGHLVPDHMGLRVAVQQEQGRAATAFDVGDPDTIDFCGVLFKSSESWKPF